MCYNLISEDKIQSAIEANKNLMFICGSCGAVSYIGADKQPDMLDPSKDCYMMYTYKDATDNFNITEETFKGTVDEKPVSEVYYSKGIGVPMKTRVYAKTYIDGFGFQDIWYPNFWDVDRSNVTLDEMKNFIQEFRKNSTTVDMVRFINENEEDVLKAISSRGIKGLDWKGTPYEDWWLK